jgi:hypothetical protein
VSTLSEVVRSGKKFKRTEWKDWALLQGKSICMSDGKELVVDAEMLLSNDWEYEPKKMELSAQDMIDVAKIVARRPITQHRRFSGVEWAKLMIEELGLGE